MGVVIQALCTGIVCYLCMSMGIVFTWPSSTFKLFGSANTTLNRPMTENELAMFGSLSSIGAMISTPIAGFVLNIIGRKYCTIIFALTHVVVWSLIVACNIVEVLLAAIFISGIGGAAFLVTPVYVSEFCQDSIRGTMTSGTMLFYGVGMLLSYVFGGYLDYNIMLYTSLSVSVVGVLLLSFLKESPTFLMQKGREEEAAKSLAFYRQCDVDSKEVLQAMNDIRKSLNPDSDLTPEEEKLNANEKQPDTPTETEQLSTWQFIKKYRSSQYTLVLCLVLVTASIFQGLLVVQVYAEPMFEEAVPNMSPTICSIIFAIITVASGFAAAYLSDLLGRRDLMIYSSLVCGLMCVLLGTQLHLKWGPHWMTALIIYLFCFVYTCGGGNIPYVYMAEVFAPQIKSIASMLVVEWAWMCNFILLFIFNPLVSLMGFGQIFYLFAVICFFTSVFCWKYMPETKGLTVDAIQKVFSRSRRKTHGDA